MFYYLSTGLKWISVSLRTLQLVAAGMVETSLKACKVLDVRAHRLVLTDLGMCEEITGESLQVNLNEGFSNG